MAYGNGPPPEPATATRSRGPTTSGRTPPTSRWPYPANGARGIAVQSLFVAHLVMAGNVRKIATFRQLVQDGPQCRAAALARRRLTSPADFRPPP
jgi:hypothetical protein